MSFFLPYIFFINIFFISFISQYCYGNNSELDYLEDFNRVVFKFNYEILDVYIVRPAAIFWRNYLPKSVRSSLKNFFINLEEPATAVNYFIEGKFYKSVMHFNRFFINTIFGIGGIFDVAAITFPVLSNKESRDFGHTLGFYGIGYGAYLQLPCYGNFTIRQDLGGIVDNCYPLLSYLTWWMFIGKWILKGLENRANLLNHDSLLYISHDPYITVRTAYFQYNEFLIKHNTHINDYNIK